MDGDMSKQYQVEQQKMQLQPQAAPPATAGISQLDYFAGCVLSGVIQRHGFGQDLTEAMRICYDSARKMIDEGKKWNAIGKT